MKGLEGTEGAPSPSKRCCSGHIAALDSGLHEIATHENQTGSTGRLEAYIYDTVCDALIDGVKEQLVVDVLLITD